MPDGNQEDLWVHDDRQAVTRITFTNIEHDMPSISPDGNTVYFATGTESDYRIARKSMDRNEPEEILVPAGELMPHYYAACPVLAHDGKTLFYTTIGANGKQDVAWLDVSTGSTPQRFLAGAAAEYGARPSPVDSRYVAYVSDESGDLQVYITTWPDADQKLPVSIGGGLWPRWKGDGTELYFALDDKIYAVPISYEPLGVGRPRELFTRLERDDRQPYGWPATFGVTPDGERFLTTEIVQDDSLDPRIAIVENWAQTMGE
jgi:Tol biopolymer transport system component